MATPNKAGNIDYKNSIHTPKVKFDIKMEKFITNRYDLFLKDFEAIVNIDSSSENS